MQFNPVINQECVQQQFEIAAQRHPDAIAVRDPTLGITWTYRELNERANQLAQHILNLCPGLPHGGGDNVGIIYVQRSAYYVLFLVAYAKAGLPYLPIDVAIPADRLEYIIEDSKALVVLTLAKYGEKLQSTPRQSPLCICAYDTKEVQQTVSTLSISDMAVRSSWDKAVYVIYTSGSTGKPKGVNVHHGGCVNLVQHAIHQFKITSKDVICQILGAAFDPVTMELWPGLCSAAEIVIIDDETKLSGVDKIMDFFVKYKVTFVILPTALADGFIHLAPTPELVLRVLTCGGDRLHGIPTALPYAFINCYGPTETSVMCTSFQTHGDRVPDLLLPGMEFLPQPRSVDPPIGRSVSNAAVYVLDKQMRPVPNGYSGELYVTGAGVALGYRNKIEQTKAVFLPDTVTPPGSKILLHALQPPRMYRTGDLVRIHPIDEQIDFIGRVDFQVKIRGFRIELGEIETIILSFPGIAEGVCIVKNDKLIAYMVAEPAPTTVELKKYVQTKLPEYMTPSAFIFMPRLPLTTNNKVDRHALQALEVAFTQEAVSEVAPTTEVEVRICKMWCEILGVPSVGALDNWFDRGGSSLASTLLLAKMRSTFHMEISLAQFFSAPTVKGLAKVVSQQGNLDVADHIDAILIKDAGSLDSDIVPKAEDTSVPKAAPTSIFLTGATGFLGAYILIDVLQNTKLSAYCLVRAKTDDEGVRRIVENVSRYDPTFPTLLAQDPSRLVGVVGDLGKPLLGMSQAQYDKMCGCIDIILHNGALVNFSYPYMSMRAANVEGTKVLLRMAVTQRMKTFHYVSTLSVLVHGNVAEDFVSEDPAGLEGGYTQTKWVAERLVHEAFKRGIAVSISRPGRITGHSVSGAANTDGDFMLLLIKGCVQMGAAPSITMPIELNPVDFCARATTLIATTESFQDGKIFHLHNPMMIPWSDVVQCLVRLGYVLRVLPYAKWRTEVMALTNADHNALMPLVPQFSDGFEKVVSHVETYVVRNSQTLLKSAMCHNTINKPALLEVYIGYLVKSGFLPKA
jgi:amino acid adenylation domain-containing protein/thioester reductase-like protein